MSKTSSFQINHLKGNHHLPLDEDFCVYDYKYLIKDNKNNFQKKYEDVLNICFAEKPQLIKFDATTSDEEIDRFFDSL